MLKKEEIRRIELKIAALEKLTSAEFKVILCSHAWFGLKRKARTLFAKYRLDKTRERNGVLILLVEKDREFLIYGGEGITAVALVRDSCACFFLRQPVHSETQSIFYLQTFLKVGNETFSIDMQILQNR